MILVVPFYADIEELAEFAKYLKDSVSIYISGDDATKANLDYNFNSNKQELMLMSHGEYKYPLCNNKEAAIKLDELRNFLPYNIYSYTCNTAEVIGKAYGVIGGVWFGYDGRIAMPSPNDITRDAYISIFSYIIDNFPKVKDRALADKFLIDLRDVCDKAIDMILNIDIFAIGSEEQAINNIWERVVISIEGEQIQHEKATPGNHPPLFHKNNMLI